MTVDLDALANDLRAAGVPNWMEHDALKADASLIVHASGRVEYDGDYDLFALAPREIETIAIIARHLGAGQPVAAGETLYRKCTACEDGIVSDRGGRHGCSACRGAVYIPVDSPAPLRVEEYESIRVRAAKAWHETEDTDAVVDAVLAALPARYAVPVEGA